MRESTVEARLVRLCKDRGWRCLKFVSPGWAGAPDRLILIPGGEAVFIEVKAPGKKARPLQILRQEQLQALGFKAYVDVDSYERVAEVIKEIGG